MGRNLLVFFCLGRIGWIWECLGVCGDGQYVKSVSVFGIRCELWLWVWCSMLLCGCVVHGSHVCWSQCVLGSGVSGSFQHWHDWKKWNLHHGILSNWYDPKNQSKVESTTSSVIVPNWAGLNPPKGTLLWNKQLMSFTANPPTPSTPPPTGQFDWHNHSYWCWE